MVMVFEGEELVRRSGKVAVTGAANQTCQPTTSLTPNSCPANTPSAQIS